MAELKIVDAVSTTNPATVQQKVPVKIDGTALAEMMSKIASAPQRSVEYVSPAEYVLAAGTRMKDMYARYDMLRKLGSTLHGKSFSDPVPAEVQIESVSIKFRLANEAELGEAKIFNIACVGDIAQLLSTEMGTIIMALQQEAKALNELSKSTEDTAQKARESWENSNKDRKIVVTTPTPEAAPSNEN
jgi:hypothetical protein